MLHPLNHLFSKHAPVFIGAAFCTGILLLAACKRRQPPEWEFPPATTSNTGNASPAPVSPARPAENFRLLSYNLKNWLEMERNGQPAPKPEVEKQAVVSLIASQRPDIVGVCEIGTADDLADLRNRLKNNGLDLPNFVHHGGADPVRHLGLLTRFPILRTTEAAKTTYQISGKTHGIQRGILDATLQIGSDSYRILGVHLKSRLEVETGDQAQMRLEEARLLRAHVDGILKTDPATRLIVYGDFNDSRDSLPLKTVIGQNLSPLPLKDHHAESWTYYWSIPETYSRIDFIFTGPSLKSSIDPETSHIVADPIWNQASDHRPILATFR
ncbi:MAG: hypothetical protein QM680_10805 [Luteolibacter sp.]